jgi:CBS domain-containing protein
MAQDSANIYHQLAVEALKMSQKNEGSLVGDYMSTNVITIHQEHSMFDAAKRLMDRNVSSLAVTDEQDRIAGILTERDIVRAVTNQLIPSGTTAGELMTRPVVSILKDATIEDAARTMGLNKIRHLVVKDPSSHEAIGIITITDLARYLKHNIAIEEIMDSEVWELFF